MFKKILMSLFLFLGLSSQVLAGDVYVNCYYRSDGTYVSPHYRSSPNSTKSDNWSTYGNTNPYTGERGTRHYDSYDNSRSSSYGQRSYDPNQPMNSPLLGEPRW